MRIMVTVCPKCGTQAVDDQSLFCNKCGAQLAISTPEASREYCPNCKTNNLDRKTGSCTQCGFPLLPKIPQGQPVVPSRTCPQCGAPVIDENRYYCKTCGAYLRDKHASKVSLADDTSGSKSSIKKPAIIPGIYQNTGTRTIIKPETGEGPGRIFERINLSNPSVKKGAILLFILFGGALLILSGISLLDSGTGLQPENDVLITQDLGSITLVISDLPSGWVSGDSEGTSDVYFAQFFTGSENSEALVEQTITRFPGIEEAKLELKTERDQVTGITMDTINLGNEGFGYIDVNYVMVIFRRGNIVVKIEDTRTEYQDNPSLQNARNYAEIVAKRIK